MAPAQQNRLLPPFNSNGKGKRFYENYGFIGPQRLTGDVIMAIPEWKYYNCQV